LEKLGFPWILSSETSLFNGLRWIFAERKFLGSFTRGGGERRDGRERFWHAEEQNWTLEQSNLFYDFQQ
jgi:hypothetical protein